MPNIGVQGQNSQHGGALLQPPPVTTCAQMPLNMQQPPPQVVQQQPVQPPQSQVSQQQQPVQPPQSQIPQQQMSHQYADENDQQYQGIESQQNISMEDSENLPNQGSEVIDEEDDEGFIDLITNFAKDFLLAPFYLFGNFFIVIARDVTVKYVYKLCLIHCMVGLVFGVLKGKPQLSFSMSLGALIFIIMFYYVVPDSEHLDAIKSTLKSLKALRATNVMIWLQAKFPTIFSKDSDCEDDTQEYQEDNDVDDSNYTSEADVNVQSQQQLVQPQPSVQFQQPSHVLNSVPKPSPAQQIPSPQMPSQQQNGLKFTAPPMPQQNLNMANQTNVQFGINSGMKILPNVQEQDVSFEDEDE